ncbi:MAG: SRPBCC family protein [Sodalis sp. (in: enterobacteria)]|uniref:SRPBCC family protein n=1 Tax=Sodalis sp. (in: enterobacteria) TaxID=1898979 RepID=UPI0039E4E8CB
MEHILTGPYNKSTNNSRRPPRGAYIFITFSDSVESIADRLRPLNALLNKYQVADLHTTYTLDYDCPFNWKMAVETFMEYYHNSAVHRTTLEDSFPGRLSYIGEDGPGLDAVSSAAA